VSCKERDDARKSADESAARVKVLEGALRKAMAFPVPYDHGVRGAAYWHRKPHEQPCVGCDLESALAHAAPAIDSAPGRVRDLSRYTTNINPDGAVEVVAKDAPPAETPASFDIEAGCSPDEMKRRQRLSNERLARVMTQAETPAPTCKCGSGEHCARHYKNDGTPKVVCAFCGEDVTCLRAELEAERKRVEEALGQIDADRIRHFNECKEREAEIARLREDVDRHAAQRAHWSNVVGKNAGIHDELAATKARLGRATAALQEALGFIDLHAHIYGVKDARELKARSRAILVDDESKAAGEYVRELEAVANHAERLRMSKYTNVQAMYELQDALATVEKRRGQVKP
jgi:hypothetical protein